MFLKEFTVTPAQRIKKLNSLLEDQFGVSIKTAFPKKAQLEKLVENADKMIIKLRNSNKKFQLDPEYAKFLGIKDIAETMLKESAYVESAAYEAMCSRLGEQTRALLDSGYTVDEACSESLNRYRMDPSCAWDDEHAKTIIIKAAKDYVEACGNKHESVNIPETDLNEYLLRELAKECGVEISDVSALEAIEEKIEGFGLASGKSRDAVVGFLNSLDEDSIVAGIQMFGRKIAEKNLLDSIQYMYKLKDEGKSIEEIAKELDMTPEEVKDAMSKTAESVEESVDDQSMFEGILDEIINEEVDVEQAEVVMAVRALADDIQDQIERLGRMMNEDVPAIADQMRAEMGASQAQGFADATNQLLSGYLESAKGAKSGMDQQVSAMTGEQPVGGLGDTAELPAEPAQEPEMDMSMDMGDGEDSVADNIPASSGEPEEPMGRASV